MTGKLDTHDVSRHRVPPDTPSAVAVALSMIKKPTLVLGIESDGLVTFAEQLEMATSIPNSRLRRIESAEGHDAFLLKLKQLNSHVLEFFHEVLPDVMNAPPGLPEEESGNADALLGNTNTKENTFGKVEWKDIRACLVYESKINTYIY